MDIDHIDIVTSHKCNFHCPYCVDKFCHTTDDEVSVDAIDSFLKLVRKHTNKDLEVLLLGGEPTVLSIEKLIDIADVIKNNGFVPIMSSNGFYKDKIIQLLGHYRWIQVTAHTDAQIDFWRKYRDNVNIKWCGDAQMTFDVFKHFVEYTKDFERRSISMYSTADFNELCTDKHVWDLLDSLSWTRNGSYLYTFYEGVRIKRFIKGETNIIDEPSVPKLYPNGNYNKTWLNEDMDDYLRKSAKELKENLE